MPTYMTFLLKSVEFGSDNNVCNVQATIIIRFAMNTVLDFLISNGIVRPEDAEALKEDLRCPKIRVNDAELPDFNKFRSNSKDLKFSQGNNKPVKIGYANTYRAQFEEIEINGNNFEIAKYPFDKSYLNIKFEIINYSKLKGEYTIIYNCHNAAAMPVNEMFLHPFELHVRKQQNSQYRDIREMENSKLDDHQIVKKYRTIQKNSSNNFSEVNVNTPNFSPNFPCKNYNEFNIFSVKNDPDTGTKNIENLDVYEMFNNCEGYWYNILEEKRTVKDKDNQFNNCYSYNKIEFFITIYRNPYYVIKATIVPILILMYFAAGCNFFGEEDVQFQNIITFYLSFGAFMSQATEDIKATSSLTMVDLINLFGYVINILQFFILLVSNFKYYNGEIYKYRNLSPELAQKISVDNNLRAKISDFLALASFWTTTIFSFFLTIYILKKIISYNKKEARYNQFMNMKKKIGGDNFQDEDWVYKVPLCKFDYVLDVTDDVSTQELLFNKKKEWEKTLESKIKKSGHNQNANYGGLNNSLL